MAGNIKGITIEFRGETTNLSKAISTVRSEARGFDKELGYINNSLKFNPDDVRLTAQKMQVLKEAADDSEKRVKELKDALQQMKDNEVDETSAEYRELEREIVRTESKQKSYNAELEKLKHVPSTLEKLSTKFETMGSKLESAGNALMPLSTAGAAVDVALAGMAVKAGQAADDLNTLSIQTGVSTTDLQKYKAAADLVDVSVETMAKSQVKLKKSMYQAETGSKNMADAFDTLGVSITDSNGELRDQGEVFDEVIAALGSMSNETERDAIAMQIFGKNASALNSIIEDGGETYAEVARIFEESGLEIVDQETLDKANDFNDAIDKIKLTGATAFSQMGTELAAALAPAMEKVVGLVEKIAKWLTQLSPETLTLIGVIAGVVAGLAPLLIVIGKVATGISAIMSLASTIGPIIAGLAGPIGIAVAAIGGIIAIGVLLYKNWDTIKAKATEIKDWVVVKWTELKTSVSTLVDNIKTKVTTVWDNIKTAVSGAVEAVKTKVTTIWTNIKTSVSTTVDAIKTKITTIWTNIKTSVSTTVDNIKTKISNVWDGIKTKVTTVVDAIKTAVATKFETIKSKIVTPIEKARDLIKAAIDKIKSIIGGVKLQLPHFKLPHLKVSAGEAPWGIGGKGKLPSFSVDWYKKGGIFDSPTLIGVGEAGPEAVLPIEKLKDWMQPQGIVINVYGSDNMSVNELAAAVERKLVNSIKQKKYAWG